MKVKQVKVPPKDGTQFVAMWAFGTGLWSDSCRYNEHGYLEVFSNELDDFEAGTLPDLDMLYFVTEEQ